MRVIHRIVHIALTPVSAAVDSCHPLRKAKIFKKKRHAKLAVGTVFILGGSFAAAHPIGFVPHFLWDAGCWLLHGYGALPVVKVLCEKYDLEHIEEACEASIKKLEDENRNDNAER